MTRIQHLLDLMNKAWQGEAWHGPSLSEILIDVTAEEAYNKPGKTHSIREITEHIAVWKEVAVQRLSGNVVEPTEREDWPDVSGQKEQGWEKTKARLRRAHTDLCTAVGNLSDVDLERPVPGRNHTIFVMLHGVIHHDLYHGGQIALLKKNRS